MLLAVNIGNTNIRFAVFLPNDEIKTWVINSKPYRTEDELFAKFSGMYEPFGIKKNEISDIVIGSVVPSLTLPIYNSLSRIHQIEPLLVNRETPSNVRHTSKQMGTDLYANAVAGQTLYSGKKIIVDFGTALTFTGVDENGKTMGVAIAPGIKTALKSLVGETAQLPEIELIPPKNILGFDTVSCMQSGMVYGFSSMVEGMIKRIDEETKDTCFVVATGGLSSIFAPIIPRINTQDTLHTIKGLKFLYDFNQK